jgi:hypothetical protein
MSATVLGRKIPADLLMQYLKLRFTEGHERVMAHRQILEIVGEENGA